VLLFLGRAGNPAGAPAACAGVTAGVALLVSPTSWSHHWVWIAPALLIAGVSAWRARSTTVGRGQPPVLAVTFVVAPFQLLPHGNGAELTWSVLQQAIGASYVIITMAVYMLLWLAWRRRPARQPVAEQPATSTSDLI